MKPSESNNGKSMPANRIATQARVCAHQAVECITTVLFARHPADRTLRDIFLHNRQFGSRDRRIISETVYSVLRWWGWLSKLAPEYFTKALEAGEKAPAAHGSDWYPVLAASWLLENRFELPSSVMFWLREAKLYPEAFADIPEDTPFNERRKYLRPFFLKRAMPSMTLEELMPLWFQEELCEELAADYRKFLDWQQRRPPAWIRAQTKDLGKLVHDVEAQAEGKVRMLPHEQVKGAYAVRNAAANFRGLPAFQEGRFEMQDIAAQCAGLVCAPKPGQQWWDACAGGGGKSLHLAWLMQNSGTVLATDLREEALEELKKRAHRGKFGNIRTRVWKGNPIPENMKGKYDGVLVDVPCTCSGTWRRAPEGRWNTTRDMVAKSAETQLRLLENASAAVRPGGTLVYSTCSVLRAENLGVIEKFLAAHPDFVLDPHPNPMDGVITPGMTQIKPWDADSDAMFTAKMHRRKG
ncbi:MAG: RsmB/NOP family class I SAM-dependent RNA methyltransferase [Victivallales bacterium]|nr:RsmB/NOP family class I SAM-dependent RNA methyltransferase [Victivallales bacterium]